MKILNLKNNFDKNISYKSSKISKIFISLSLYSLLSLSSPVFSQTKSNYSGFSLDELLQKKDSLEVIPEKTFSQFKEYSIILNKIGILYRKSNDFQLALKYYNKVQEISHQIGDDEMNFLSRNNMAVVYLDNIKDYNSAYNIRSNLLTDLEEKDSLDNFLLKNKLFYLLNSVDALFNLQRYDEGKNKLDEAKSLLEIVGTSLAKILYLYHMAEYMVHLQQYDKAMDYYKEAYSIAVKKNDANSQKYISSAMASLYADQGIFDKAYHQTFITDAAKDSLMNETIAKERAESEKNSKVRLQAAEIETQKAQNRVKQAEIERQEAENKTKQAEIERQEAENKTKQAEIERQEAENKIKQVEIEKQEAEIKKRNAGIGLVGTATLAALLGVFYWRKKKKQTDVQNQIISQKNEELDTTNKIVTEQKEELSRIYEEITSSVRYASIIQKNILYSEHNLSELFPESFVISRPRDIVSGDFFYSGYSVDGQKVLSVADCTGHGVPAAFLTIFSNAYLKEALSQCTTPGEVLNFLHERFIEELQSKQEIRNSANKFEFQNDSMDVVIAFLDEKTNTLTYSGSGRPLWILRGEEMIALKNSSLNLGTPHRSDGSLSAETHTFQLEEGDQLYMFSDGITDQYGGKEMKRLGRAKFEQLLLKIGPDTLSNQKKRLSDYLDKWCNDFPPEPQLQTDDILLLSVKIGSKNKE